MYVGKKAKEESEQAWKNAGNWRLAGPKVGTS